MSAVTTEPKSKEYFLAFSKGFENVDQDWEGMRAVFAEDAHIKYGFAGFPINEGNEEAVHAGFKAALSKFRVKFTYVAGSDTDCICSAVACFETTKGESAVYTTNGYLEFNSDGKVTKKAMYSTDSEKLANIIVNAIAGDEEKKDEE